MLIFMSIVLFGYLSMLMMHVHLGNHYPVLVMTYERRQYMYASMYVDGLSSYILVLLAIYI